MSNIVPDFDDRVLKGEGNTFQQRYTKHSIAETLFASNKSEGQTLYQISMTRRSKARVTPFNSDTGNARSPKPIHHKQK
jgi:hypothetical protein